MTIPSKYKIFGSVVPTSKDCERLLPHLQNWAILHEIMLLGSTADDLRMLIQIELATRQRCMVLRRLNARLHVTLRNQVQDSISKCLA
jgi:hypothetical protein